MIKFPFHPKTISKQPSTPKTPQERYVGQLPTPHEVVQKKYKFFPKLKYNYPFYSYCNIIKYQLNI